jgi:hypothetical protein
MGASRSLQPLRFSGGQVPGISIHSATFSDERALVSPELKRPHSRLTISKVILPCHEGHGGNAAEKAVHIIGYAEHGVKVFVPRNETADTEVTNIFHLQVPPNEADALVGNNVVSHSVFRCGVSQRVFD